MVESIKELKNNLILNFSFLFCLILILEGLPVPSGAEYSYLLLPIKHWNTNYLLNDWTFSQPWLSHYVFNSVVGAFTPLFSLNTIGWTGRVLCWTLSIIALFQIGKHFHIPRCLITLSISLWLINGQSIVAGSNIIGGFMASSVAYVLLLFALCALLSKRDILSSILLGLSFSFHSAVGFWAILAIVPSLVILKYPIKRLVQMSFYTALFSLPGLIPMLPVVFGRSSFSPDLWRFYVLVAQPDHLDPFSWVRRDLLLVYILFAFNWLHFRRVREDKTMKFFVSFQSFLCIFFSLGLFLRYTENYELLKFYPFRLFAVFVPLFFFFHLMNAYYCRESIKLGTSATALALLALLSFSNPLGQLVDHVHRTFSLWTKNEDDVQRCFKWISENTPNESIAILPPWRGDSWHLSRRGQIVNFGTPAHRLEEWRERIVALLGDNLRKQGEDWAGEFEARYNRLTESDIAKIVERYGGEYLVSKRGYVYPVLFDTETYKVYSLRKIDLSSHQTLSHLALHKQ